MPIDPDHPADRTAYILDTAQPVCVLATSREDVETPAHLPVLHVDLIDGTEHDGRPITDRERTSPLRPANTAYVIFTSGSTGRPRASPSATRRSSTSWNGSAPNTDWTPRMPRCSRPRRPRPVGVGVLVGADVRRTTRRRHRGRPPRPRLPRFVDAPRGR
ncbi:AMP-binding protein [Rhodococcus hoagii]|nr:AMP-binding protein [Prescottella equi]